MVENIFQNISEQKERLKHYSNAAFSNGWISEEKMHELAKPMLKNQYGQYLLKVIEELKEEINSTSFNGILG